MSQMEEQIARLIANRLASGAALSLPETGSLYVAFHGARKLSKKLVQPPFRRVEFTAEQRGETLPELIARAAACDAVTARTIYDRWLTQTCREGTLTIVGVGTLAHEKFKMTAEFDKRLNPQGHAPVRIRRKQRFDWVLVIGIVAIVASVAAIWYYLAQEDLFPNGDREEPAAIVQPASPVVPADSAPAAGESDAPDPNAADERAADEGSATVAPETADAARERTVAEPQVAEVPAVPPVPAPGGADYTKPAPGYYVVMGVFSTRENAESARKLFAAEQPGWNYTIYLFGNKFMLSCYASPSETEARDFVRRAHDRFPDIWVHTAR